jgi:transposase-like protein
MAILKTFESLLPEKPYYCDETGALRIAGRDLARSAAHIQFNGPTHKRWLVFDIDRADAIDLLQDPHVPSPNIFTINPANGRAHAFVLIDTPVRTALDGSSRALRFCEAVERALCVRFGADRGYSGLIAKNPLHPHWVTFPLRDRAYSLGELADWFSQDELNAPWEPLDFEDDDSELRNVITFEKLRLWSYMAIQQLDNADGYERWHNAVFQRCVGIQQQFKESLPTSEIKAIAKSVARWTYQRFRTKGHSEAFLQTQRERGKKGGQAKGMAYEPKRSEALTMRRSGMTIKRIAEQLGVSELSIKRWTRSER